MSKARSEARQHDVAAPPHLGRSQEAYSLLAFLRNKGYLEQDTTNIHDDMNLRPRRMPGTILLGSE